MIDATTRARLPRRAMAGAWVPALLAGLVACSGGDPAGSAAVPTAPTPIKIGVMANIGGPTGEVETGASQVLEIWAEETNASGGIGGHPVELVVRSTREDATTASRIARQFIDDPSVVAVVHASAATESVVGEQFSRSDLPVVGGEGYSPLVWSNLPNWFGLTTTFPQVVDMQVAAAEQVGASTLTFVACAEQQSCLGSVPLVEQAAQAASIAFAGTVQVAASADDYTAECRTLIDNGTDFVQLSISPSLAARFADDCVAAGYTGFFGASAGSVTPTLFDTPQIRLAGGLNAFPWWVDDAPVQRYRSLMEARGIDREVWAQPTATALWATGELLTTALSDAVGPPYVPVTREMVLGAYNAVSDETLGGLLPQPLTFRAGQPAPAVQCYWLYQYVDGAFRGSLEPACPS